MYPCVVQDFKEEAFYPESESEESSSEDSENEKKKKKKPVYTMDSDHRLLLKNAKPLLQSRNSAVSYTMKCSIDAYKLLIGCYGYSSVVSLHGT